MERTLQELFSLHEAEMTDYLTDGNVWQAFRDIFEPLHRLPQRREVCHQTANLVIVHEAREHILGFANQKMERYVQVPEFLKIIIQMQCEQNTHRDVGQTENWQALMRILTLLF